MEIKFSIIMPAYNAGLYIEASIKSVLAQTYPYFELIIIDDGSTDNTFDIINSFDDKRIKVVHQENNGVVSARNNGISKGLFDYTAFLDADDLWTPTKLQNLVDNIESDIGLYYSNAMEFVEKIDKAIPNRYKEHIKNISNKDLILVYDFIITSSVVVSSNVLLEFKGFSKEFNGTEDWDLWIRIGQKYNFKKIENFDCYYRMNPNGLSKNRKVHLLEEYKVIQKHLLDNNMVSVKIKNISLWVWYKKNFYFHLMNFDIMNSFKFFYKMILANPFSIHNFDFVIRISKKIFSKIVKKD